MVRSTISYLWRDKDAFRGFRSGVSLHGHTNQSEETLDLLANLGNRYMLLRPLFSWLERRSVSRYGVHMNYAASYWTPPLTPKLAFDLESRQIESLDMAPMVSLTDHDNIHAPMLLRTVPSARRIPVSVEWSVPFGGQSFHLGVHNLPSVKAAEWMQTLAGYTSAPQNSSRARLAEILHALHDEPNVLVVFNHPLWDLYLVGQEKHGKLVYEFLRENGACIDALELNGLRNWEENRAVLLLAMQWNMLTISGGDRHGVEPNANINLTNAACFTEFVHEIRSEKRSNVLFMPQYARPWKHRILQSTLDAIRRYPDFPQGSRRWDERVYHPDASGTVRPLSELWRKGAPPRVVNAGMGLITLLGRNPVSNGLRMAWSDSRDIQMALGENHR